ncbi:MAG: c-type cytochrome [Bacteroidota bacterium]
MSRRIPSARIIFFFLLFLPDSAFNDARLAERGNRQPVSADSLFSDLACGNCHGGIPQSGDVLLSAPSLSYAGLRYNPAYLFRYLGSPTRVRRHIGSLRMPDFGLDEKERLALTMFLAMQQQRSPTLPRFLAKLNNMNQRARSGTDIRNLIVEELRCTACHTFQGEGGEIAGELMDVGERVKPDWLAEYLAFPQAFDPRSPMPAVFYTMSEVEQRLREVVLNAADKIESLVTYFDSTAVVRRTLLDREFERAKAAHPTVTARQGEKIFVALNCAACHLVGSMRAWQNAPDLSAVGSRVTRAWLGSYLERPEPIRSFGFYPGTGSRMPDYNLTGEEIKTIGDYLFAQKPTASRGMSFLPGVLSPFGRAKAVKLVKDKLPCLGCHSLNGDGGKVAPDLSGIGTRLQPDYVRAIIEDPASTAPGSIMPKTPMTENEVELIARYLLQNDTPSGKTVSLPLTEAPTIAHSDTGTVKGLYLRYCSPCHGETGNGDGFNAHFLPLQPAPHASASAMSGRSDDTLFDGIHSGGAILTKNHRMPAFGETLSREQIRAIVRYIRELCQCEGPVWSRN